MKRFWKIVSIALICGALVSPQLEARGRNDRGNSRTEHRSGQSSASRSNRGNNKASHPKNIAVIFVTLAVSNGLRSKLVSL